MSSYAEISFLAPKKFLKSLKIESKVLLFSGRYGWKKYEILRCKMEQFTFAVCSYKKLEPKTPIFKELVIFSESCRVGFNFW
jgi:hypothetical protein